MPPHGVQLPEHSIFGGRRRIAEEESIDQPRDEVGSQRQTCGDILLALMLGASALEKGSVRQDIRRRRGLTEEVLRREQYAPFQ